MNRGLLIAVTSALLAGCVAGPTPHPAETEQTDPMDEGSLNSGAGSAVADAQVTPGISDSEADDAALVDASAEVTDVGPDIQDTASDVGDTTHDAWPDDGHTASDTATETATDNPTDTTTDGDA